LFALQRILNLRLEDVLIRKNKRTKNLKIAALISLMIFMKFGIAFGLYTFSNFVIKLSEYALSFFTFHITKLLFVLIIVPIGFYLIDQIFWIDEPEIDITEDEGNYIKDYMIYQSIENNQNDEENILLD